MNSFFISCGEISIGQQPCKYLEQILIDAKYSAIFLDKYKYMLVFHQRFTYQMSKSTTGLRILPETLNIDFFDQSFSIDQANRAELFKRFEGEGVDVSFLVNNMALIALIAVATLTMTLSTADVMALSISPSRGSHLTNASTRSTRSNQIRLHASQRSTTATKELHLLTFDLDDTLFPITPVIQDANAVMIQTLNSLGYEADNEEIISHSKRIRRELREKGEEITYSDLRRGSIRCEMERLASNNNYVVDESNIEKVFNSWLIERHASANRNLFPHAAFSLQAIREQFPSVTIGAITNGRGDPFSMPSIAEYFDFCTSGEDKDVFPLRKPDRGIYEAALGRYKELTKKNIEETDDSHWNWIHVGDDLANDIGASAACGAKTIWLTTLDNENEEGAGFWSTATPEEMQLRKKMDEMARQFVNEKIYALDGLTNAIECILRNR